MPRSRRGHRLAAGKTAFFLLPAFALLFLPTPLNCVADWPPPAFHLCPVWRLKPGPWLLSRAHGGDPVRGKGSRAHGTGGKLLPCAPRGLVRTESASCARRCFTPPYCPTPRCSSHAAPLFRSLAEQTPAGAPSARWERKRQNRLTPGQEAGHRGSCWAHSPAR